MFKVFYADFDLTGKLGNPVQKSSTQACMGYFLPFRVLKINLLKKKNNVLKYRAFK
jgi:hypothetical protein